MAKRTAVVDLGSNSVRLVIFEKTSRYAFHILCEHKRRVRIGENAYNNGKVLQEQAMARAKDTLAYFKAVAAAYKCKKVLIVGTSALRDAPNKAQFINDIRKSLKLNIRCIDGRTESYLGGLSALNLLSNVLDATTLDIGGGSSELCLIQNGRIKDCISLDIGTVRLKELFFDRGRVGELDEFLSPIFTQLPPHFKNKTLIAIGGSLRAISSAIMNKNNYPLKTLHEFCYNLKVEQDFIESIIKATNAELPSLFIKKERFDTIREGARIFLTAAKALNTETIITSGVGIREGVYLQDILGKQRSFPPTFNPSIKSLQDRFLNGTKSPIPRLCGQIFDCLVPLHSLENSHKATLINAAKLCEIGTCLDFYHSNTHSAYFVLNALNFNISHAQKVLIAAIISGNSDFTDTYAELLPENAVLLWLSFILALAKALALNHFSSKKLDFAYKDNVLYIYCEDFINLPKDAFKKLEMPETIALAFNQKP